MCYLQTWKLSHRLMSTIRRKHTHSHTLRSLPDLDLSLGDRLLIGNRVLCLSHEAVKFSLSPSAFFRSFNSLLAEAIFVSCAPLWSFTSLQHELSACESLSVKLCKSAYRRISGPSVSRELPAYWQINPFDQPPGWGNSRTGIQTGIHARPPARPHVSSSSKLFLL